MKEENFLDSESGTGKSDHYAYKIEPVFLGWTGVSTCTGSSFACSHTGRAER